MKWYQHDSGCHNDEIMRELIHLFGVEGYGVYHICLELVSEKIDENLQPTIKILDRVLREKLRVSRQKMTKILAFFDQNSLIFSNLQSEYWILNCPNLLKRLDNWTKRSVVPTKQVSLESDQESEVEIEKIDHILNFTKNQSLQIRVAISNTMGHGLSSTATGNAYREICERVKKLIPKKDIENVFAYTLAAAKNEELQKPQTPPKVSIKKPDENIVEKWEKEASPPTPEFKTFLKQKPEETFS